MSSQQFAQLSHLTTESRARALAEMSSGTELDVLVIGGGITGAGIALDAATRGLRTGIVEAGDWAAGTSAWSSKLIHGGLRYLYNLDFKLVTEALKERGLLLEKIAPHLVHAQPFLSAPIPLSVLACTMLSHISVRVVKREFLRSVTSQKRAPKQSSQISKTPLLPALFSSTMPV